MHIVLRSQTVLHNLQQKRTNSSLFCSSPWLSSGHALPALPVLSHAVYFHMPVSSAYPISLCDFPSLELPLALTEESEKLAHLPHPHPSPSLLFSWALILLLNQYSVFALQEPGKHCLQPSQRVKLRVYFLLLVSQMLIMASVGLQLLISFWELCLWPPTAVLKVENNIRTPVGVWVHFFSSGETSLLDFCPEAPEYWSCLAAHTAAAHAASFQLSFAGLLPRR